MRSSLSSDPLVQSKPLSPHTLLISLSSQTPQGAVTLAYPVNKATLTPQEIRGRQAVQTGDSLDFSTLYPTLIIPEWPEERPLLSYDPVNASYVPLLHENGVSAYEKAKNPIHGLRKCFQRHVSHGPCPSWVPVRSCVTVPLTPLVVWLWRSKYSKTKPGAKNKRAAIWRPSGKRAAESYRQPVKERPDANSVYSSSSRDMIGSHTTNQSVLWKSSRKKGKSSPPPRFSWGYSAYHQFADIVGYLWGVHTLIGQHRSDNASLPKWW